MNISLKNLLIAVVAISALGYLVVVPKPNANAAYNMVMNYQGKLTNSSYVAVPDGTYNMEFKLYDASTSGSLLWTETRTGGNKVQVTNGLFNVMLGEVSSLTSLDFNKTLFLTVTIGGTGTPSWDTEMTPRKKLGTVPAAFIANSLIGTGTIDITNTGSAQASINYDGSNKLTVGVASTGFTTLTAVGTAAGFNLTGGNVGIGSSTVSAKLHVTATTEQLRVGYDVSNYTSFTTSSGGDLTIAPSGSDLAVTGNVDVSGTLTAGTANAFNVDSSGNITAGNYQGTIITSAYGGTGNGFTKFSGPTTSEKTFTLPNASATLLYDGGALGTPSSGVATNLTGTATGLTAGKATNLVGGNATTLLGSLPYQSNTDTTTMLSPNTSATKKFLSQTGTGTNGAAPAWAVLTSTDVGLGNVENTALSTWAGTTNITTLGTITSGTWSGTTIAVTKGGTGTTDGSITGTGALGFTAGGSGNSITLTGTTSGVVKVASSTANTDTISLKPQISGTGATFAGIITTADLTVSDKTYTFPNATITVNAAADISGTTLASNVTASSLTSVGTLTSLALGGAVTGATSYNGLVVTANTGVITTGTWQGGIISGTYGGTNNGFFAVTGPTTSTKTFTFPNASATVLTDNALVTVAQGGTGAGTLTGLLLGNGTSAVTALTTSSGVSGALSDETGTGGLLVFNSSPTIITPTFTTSATTPLLTNAGGLTISTTASNANVTVSANGTGVLSVVSSTANTDSIQIKPQVTGTGATFNGIITSADLTVSDKTWTFPNVTGTVITTGDTGTVTNTMLAGSIAASKLVGSDIATVGTLTAGSTGSGFTVALGSSTITGTLGATNGGTGNNYFAVSGPATSTKTFTFPNASATVLTDNAAVTVAQGGTGVGTLALNGILYGNNTGAIQALAVNSGAVQCLTQASSAAPAWGSCGAGGSTAFDAIVDPSGNGAVAMGATVQTLDWGSITSTTGLAITGGSAMTSGTLFKVGTATFTHTGTETGNLANLVFTDSTTSAVTATTNGLLISPTISAASGAATRTINGLSVAPAFTNCAAGTCAVNGINVGDVTDGTGFTGTGLKVGSGWDLGLAIAGNPSASATGASIQLANALTSGSSAGTFIAANAVSGFTGNLADLQVNGTSRFKIGYGTVTTSGASAVAGTFQDLVMNNSTTSGFQFGNRLLNTVSSTVGGTHDGMFIRMTDSTSLSTNQIVRGLEVQAYSGTNNNGINTGIQTYGKTFGLSAETSGQAGGVSVPAAVFAYLNNAGVTTSGNALRAYTDTATSANLVSIYQETSAYTGTGLEIDLGNGAGSYTGNFVNFKKAGVSKFSVSDTGAITASGALALGSNTITSGAITAPSLTSTSGLALTSAAASNVTITAGTTGGVIVQSGSGSANSFQVKDSSGNSIMSVNTASGAGGANLIYNSNFEQNIHNWIAKGTPTNSTPVWDNTASNAKYGTGTLKLSGDAVGDGAQYSFPFAATTQYSASFWAKTSSGTATLRLDRQDNGSDVGGCSDSSVTTTWTQFTCTFTTGSTINTSTSNIFIKQNAAGTPTVYIDGFTLTLGGTSMNFTAPANQIQVDSDYSNITLNVGQDADVQPWQSNTTPLPTALRGAASVTANGFVYYIGGNPNGAASNAISYARMNTDGSLSAGSWLSTTLPVGIGLYGHSSFVANGYLYVIGGCSDSSATAACTTPVSTVYYSKLNSDGTLGTWQTSQNPLPAARGFGATVFSNGFVYYIGGYNSSAQTTVYSSRLNADGSVGGWATAGVTALGTARYGETTMNVNGKIYSIGGCTDAGALCNTQLTTVEYATPANDGTLGAWTAATSLPVGTGFHTTGILNGYLFNVGGRQSSAAVSTVYYAKVNSVGPLGIWATSSNALPAARQQAGSLFANTYLYNLGGYDGTTLATSAFFGSGARVNIFGGLDLLALSSQTLTDYSGGGALTAGNTRIVGDLRIDGFADLNNGLTVDSVINLNAVSATTGQTVFNINNSSSNSIFSVRHMNSNFGSLATAGAFVDNMSYFGEEFSQDRSTTALTADSVRGVAGSLVAGVGDGQEFYFDTFTGTTTTYSTPSNVINGVGRLSFPATTGMGAVVATGSVTAATINKAWQTTNLPVLQMKVKPSANTATNDMLFGFTDAYAASGTNDTLPTNGIYFWNNNAAGGWQGVVKNGVTTTTVTCSGAISTSQFAVLRIEVLSATTVRFAVDNDASDGTNLIDCGTVTATPPAGPYGIFFSDIHTVAATATIDVDYIRAWQDDSPVLGAESIAAPSTADSSTEQLNPLEVETIPEGFNAKKILADLMTQFDLDSAEATSEQVAIQQTDLDRLVVRNEIVAPHIIADALTINSINAVDKSIMFMDDTSFIGRPYFSSDTAGFAVIKTGDRKVTVEFDDEYLSQPIVNASVSMEQDDTINKAPDIDLSVLKDAEEQAAQDYLDSGVSFVIVHKNTKGFTIMLSRSASQDIKFSWIALAVKGAKISLSNSNDETPSDTNSSTNDDSTSIPANEESGESSGGSVAGEVSDLGDSEQTPPEEAAPQEESPQPESPPVETSSTDSAPSE